MTLILSGTNGLSDVDGSAATPAIRGTDANTGIFFPAADTIAFAEGGAEIARFDSSGNLGIGTSSPTAPLDVKVGTGNFSVGLQGAANAQLTASGVLRFNTTAGTTVFAQNATESMRIDSDGGVRINNTSNATFSAQLNTQFTTGFQCGMYLKVTNTSSSQSMMIFGNTNNDAVGSIATSGSGTSYNTSSDYRLKQDIAPMTGALAKVALLKPVTYKWKFDGSDGEGFIAHELAEVCPHAVTGEKDGVQTVEIKDEDGNVTGTEVRPIHQGIDTSFLVATLTAAIQELKALTDAQASTITDLTARITALETP